MHLIPRAAAIVALTATLPAAAQLTSPTTIVSPTAARPVGQPPALSAPATSRAPSLTRTLTVTLHVTSMARYSVSTGDATLTCQTNQTTPDGNRFDVCSAVVPVGKPVVLSGREIMSGAAMMGSSQSSAAVALPPARWGGDCAGSTGATCTLTMATDRAVRVGF